MTAKYINMARYGTNGNERDFGQCYACRLPDCNSYDGLDQTVVVVAEIVALV